MHEHPGIALLISRFFPCESGEEMQCRLFAREAAGRGCSVSVVTQRLPGLSTEETVSGVPVYRRGLPALNRLGSFAYALSGLAWLLTRRSSFDILHAHLASSPAILAGLAAKLTDRPAVLKLGGGRATGDIATAAATRSGRWKLAFLRRAIDRFVAPSSEIRDELLAARFPEDRIVMIPNGVDAGAFRPASCEERAAARRTLGLPADAVIVNYTGRLARGKGLEVLLDAWRAPGREPRARLVLIGDGPLDTALKAQAADLDGVLFAGRREDTAAWYRASDIFVLPSFGEGLPVALLEAMACGLACVTTGIGGMLDIVRNGENGSLVAPGDPEELRSALAALIGDPAAAARLGGKARETVLARYTIGSVTDRYLELYNELLDGKRS